ncbi:hypothetical protein M3644_26620 [Bacillus cereus]|uniref:hypothetical protein n=1 Tax=Bacillus cereus TaxID=1396 RepID=UPI0020409D4A|nr:hypothetical protein [Bacillus cereus]MCM3223328.1 hypothetical protein [Bacillus cereus]
MANIGSLLTKIRTAIWGKEIRGSVAAGLDAINQETESATKLSNQISVKQDALEKKYHEQIVNATDVGEIKDYHVSGTTGETYNTMGLRADHIEEQLIANAKVVTGLVEGDPDINTALIQSAYDNLEEGQRLLIPAGYWVVHGLVFHKDTTEVICLGVLAPSAVAKNVVKFGVKAGDPYRDLYKPTGLIKVDTRGDWFTNDCTGVLLENVTSADLTVDIHGCKDGLVFLGQSKGCSYNRVNVISMMNNKRSVVTEAYQRGWANENFIFGGRYGNTSGKPNYDGVVFFEFGRNHEDFTHDGMKVIAPSIENHGKIAYLKGRGHTIENARFEMLSVPFKGIEIDGTDIRINSLYDTLLLHHQIILDFEIVRSMANVFIISPNEGDLRGYFSAGKNIILNGTDGSKVDGLITFSSYNPNVGTTLYVTCDTEQELTGVTVANDFVTGGGNKIKYFAGQRLSTGQRVGYENAKVYTNHARVPVFASNSNNSGDDIFAELYYAGTKTFGLSYFGDIYARKLQLRGIEVFPTNGRPVADGEEGHFAFDNYRFGQWAMYQYVSGAWRGIAQKRVLAESGKNRPKNLGEADTGYFFMDKDITPDGKPIWWNGEVWVDADGLRA